MMQFVSYEFVKKEKKKVSVILCKVIHSIPCDYVRSLSKKCDYVRNLSKKEITQDELELS